MAQLTVGGEKEIIYNSASEDRDKYDRLLRHVSIKDVGDLGAVLIREGLANARYDSLDGYQRHRNQDAYRALDAATPHRCGPAMDAVGDGGAAPAPAPAPAPGETYYANCDAARAAGAAPLHAGQPGYRSRARPRTVTALPASDDTVWLTQAARQSLARLRAARQASDDIAVDLEIEQLGELLDALVIDLTLKLEALE